MFNIDFRVSRIGLAATLIGLIIALLCAGIVATLILWPHMFMDQGWFFSMVVFSFIAAALIVSGLSFWASFKTAEKIADWSTVAEQKGMHPLVSLAVATIFGLGMLYVAMREKIGGYLTGLSGELRDGYLLELAVMGAPVVILLGAVVIMGVHRSKRPRNVQSRMEQAQAEKRHTMMVMVATPFIILVPYFMWVAMQPPVEPYVPEHSQLD